MSEYKDAFQYKLIYIMTIPDEDHDGLVKVGMTTLASTAGPMQLPPNCDALNAAAHKRIQEYTKTALIKYNLLYTELAYRSIVMSDGTRMPQTFDDKDIQDVLARSGYLCKRFPDSGNESEWYMVDLQTSINAVKAYKEGRNVLSPSEKESSSQTSGQDVSKKFVLRQEQELAVVRTLNVFKKSDRMLWNCKMRFGKTVSAYELIRRAGYQKTIVVTHRPVVEEGWQKDHDLIFGENSKHLFVTKAINGATYEYDATIDSENDRSLRYYNRIGAYFTYFTSMQDLRGSKRVGGKFDKNRAVFDMDWDLIVYDEAHEGTQTDLGQRVMDVLESPKNKKTPKVLSLSGTPYNLLGQYDENVYSWDYVMEQKRKKEFAEERPDEYNPYADLPEMRILTFDLQKALPTAYRFETEDMAFNFREFFRTWTGDPAQDFHLIPQGAQKGDFVHEADIKSFLDLITEESEDSNYPFSTQQYRDMFRHTFWMVPGVKEARALSRLLGQHPVFKNYKVANVAGEGDKEKEYDDALKEVQSAISKNDYTITISCGRLTLGVTVPEWSAVMMLAGSANTSAAGYMQTIFRVQSVGSIDGKQKEVAYVFDFAPDRALRVLTEVNSLSTKGKLNDGDARNALGEFLNFCPVIAVNGTQMVDYDVSHLMRQIKKITVDKAIKSGFEDESIYNDGVGIVMDEEDVELFNKLAEKINGKSKSKRPVKAYINQQGLTDEEYDKSEKAKYKPKRERTEEEQALIEKRRELNKEREKVIRLLRAVSIRLPLLIYGAKFDIDEEIRMNDFVDFVDDESWEEFMPENLSKDMFKSLLKYYDEDVIVGAGYRIRRMAKAADDLPPTKRVQRITEIFSHFRNPDKETVLTPWRVVNMHMGDTIGGYNFYDECYPVDGDLDEPRLIDNGHVTHDLISNPNVRVLEMNSKSGLYPLYLAYSIYAMKLPEKESEMPLEETNKIWYETLEDNIYVLCKTKMAKSITKRTLMGYRENCPINTVYLTRLLDRMKDSKRLGRKLTNPSTWGKEGDRLKFDAIVGNPPYQLSDGGSKASATPIYNYFVEQAIELSPHYISMIMPARWYSGGRNLDAFRTMMLQDKRLSVLHDFEDFSDCFVGVDIAGGVCYFLWDSSHNGKCLVINHKNGETITTLRNLDEDVVFVRNGRAVSIIEKVKEQTSSYLNNVVSSQKPFGLRTYVVPTESGDISLRYNKGVGPYQRDLVTAGIDWIDKWKVIMSCLTYDHAGRVDKDGRRRIFSTMEILPPDEVCTETYIVIDVFDSEQEAENLLQYLKTKFVRFLVAQIVTTQHISKASFAFVPIQDFSRPWTDADLYKKYGLTDDEIAFIDATIKPMS